MSIKLKIDPDNQSATFYGLNAESIGAISSSQLTESHDSLANEIGGLESTINTLQSAISSLQSTVSSVQELVNKVAGTYTVALELALYPNGSSLVQEPQYQGFIIDLKTHFGNSWWGTYVKWVTEKDGKQYLIFRNQRWINKQAIDGILVIDYPDVEVVAASSHTSYSQGVDDVSVVRQLQRILYATGDIGSNPDNGVFDSSLTSALNAFKGRQGLSQNGYVEPELWPLLSDNTLPNWHV